MENVKKFFKGIGRDPFFGVAYVRKEAGLFYLEIKPRKSVIVFITKILVSRTTGKGGEVVLGSGVRTQDLKDLT